MAEVFDSSQPFTVDVYQLVDTLDFNGYYSFPETGSALSLGAIHVTSMLRSSQTYLQKPVPIGTGPYVLRFSINASMLEPTVTAGQSGGMMMVLLANQSSTVSYYTAGINQEGLAYSFRSYNNGTEDVYLMRITLWQGQNVYIGELGGGVTFPGITYDIELGKDSQNYPYMSIYNHGEATPIATRHPQDGQGNWMQDTNNLQYFLPMCSPQLVGDFIASGWTWNYTLSY